MIYSHYFNQSVKILVAVFLICFVHICIAETTPESSGISVQLDSNSVSANIEHLPLEAIAKELTRQANVKFFMPHSISTVRISTRFINLPFSEALKDILRNENYIMYISQQTQDDSLFNNDNHIFVYVLSSSNRSNTIQEIKSNSILEHNLPAPEIFHDLDQTESNFDSNNIMENKNYYALVDTSPEVRIEALSVLVDEYNTDSLPLVIGSLLDEDPTVRIASLEMVLDNSIGEIPYDTLSRLSINDEDLQVRILAQHLMMEHYGDSESGEPVITPADTVPN